MRVHSGLPVPFRVLGGSGPGTAMFLGALRSGESVLSEVGGLKMVATLTAELDGDRRLGLSRPAGGRPAVEMMSVTGVGTVMLRRPPAEIGVVRVLNPSGPDGC